MSCGCGCGCDACQRCDCCQGTHAITPEVIDNRPGLSALRYRVGTHGAFLETMKARLSSQDFPALARLTTRETNDASIALLDAWATVGDVLSFYTERIANEGYLRTATERRSIFELARLVGYAPRPGVASSVFLAYSLEDGHEDVPIPKGTRAQSVPGPGELPQSFETSDALLAQSRLNVIKPRLSRPARLPLPKPGAQAAPQIVFLKGSPSDFQKGELLLVTYKNTVRALFEVLEATNTPEANRIKLEVIHRQTVGNNPAPPAKNLPLIQAKQTLQSVMDGIADPKVELFANEKMDGHDSILERLKPILEAGNESPFAASKPLLEELKTAFQNTNAKALQAWLGQLINGLEQLLILEPSDIPARQSSKQTVATPTFDRQSFFSAIRAKNSVQPASQFNLERGIELFRSNMNAPFAVFKAQNPAYAIAYPVMGHTANTDGLEVEKIERFTIKAGLFGRNVPSIAVLDDARTKIDFYQDPYTRRVYYSEPKETDDPNKFDFGEHTNSILTKVSDPGNPGDITQLVLDNAYEKVKSGDTAVIHYFDPQGSQPQLVSIKDHPTVTVRRYGVSAQCTILKLNEIITPRTWSEPQPNIKQILTQTTVYTGTEKLELAYEPIIPAASSAMTQPVVGLNETTLGEDPHSLELDGVYYGLEAGRWVIVRGERIDLLPAINGQAVPSGIVDAELAMVAEVQHRFAKTESGQDWPGDTLHTFIRFAAPLKWRFKRDTVMIFSNVVKATHGETRHEVLGAGDASLAFQRFELKQPPLTYLPAPTAVGVQDTLEVRINEVRWNETPFLAGLEANDRAYEVRIDDDGKTSVVFGDGLRGSRVPTGRENVVAVYRNGIGRPGNVAANKVTLLANKPFGVKTVLNPIRASGGADRESRDQARRNAPLAVMALDRLVGVRDYEDFARTFAGIAKASATRLQRFGRAAVHVTVAGLDDIPIDESSDLYRNLLEAFRRLGDPDLPLVLAVRESLQLVVKASVRVGPAYMWALLEPKIRATMLEHFGFDARELGQDAISSEVLSVIQGVPGVEYVDLDNFGFISEQTLLDPTSIAKFVGTDARVRARLARLEPSISKSEFRPAQIAFLSPAVADTLLLSEVKS
jgi:Baseplate J-like protein